jgi:hypothetical protein
MQQYRVVYRIVFIWVALIALVALVGDVSVAQTDGGRTAADFLQIGVGAKSAGLAGAFTAVATGADAAYWNPAGIGHMEGGEVVLGHYAWYQDLSLEHGTFAYAMSDRAAIAASITYLNYGTIEGFDGDGNRTADLTAYDWAGALSLAYDVNDFWSVGVTGKFVNQKLENISGSGFAADLGTRLDFGNWSVGAALANIGSGMSFDNSEEDLPMIGRVGFATRQFNGAVTGSMDFERRLTGTAMLRQGLQWGFDERYFVRSGYQFIVGGDQDGVGSGFSFGAGVALERVVLDYAYTLQDKYTAEDLHRFSLGFRF